MTVQSSRTNGVCSLGGFADDFFTVTLVGDLAAEFTSPFYIVTVASQAAAVAIHIGWLLAGVMLGPV